MFVALFPSVALARVPTLVTVLLKRHMRRGLLEPVIAGIQGVRRVRTRARGAQRTTVKDAAVAERSRQRTDWVPGHTHVFLV